jgi:hypothetical protein
MEGFAATGGLLLGRLTYENFTRHMPNQPADDPVAGPMNEWQGGAGKDIQSDGER